MPDEQQQQQPDGALNTEAHERAENTVPYSRFKEINDAKKDLEQRLAKLEKAQSAADEQRLADQQKWQELAQKYQQERDDLLPFKEQAEQTSKTVEALLDAQIKTLPEDQQAMVRDMPGTPREKLDWLAKNAASLMRPLAPGMDAGQRGDSSKPSVKLTAQQLAIIAKTPGMTEEKYIANMLK